MAGLLRTFLLAGLLVAAAHAADAPSSEENAAGTAQSAEYRCDYPKRYCNQMTDCDEATFWWAICGQGGLDGDGDNMPCENVCPRVFDCRRK